MVKLSKLIAPIYKAFLFNEVARHLLLTGGRSSAKGDTAYTKAIKKALTKKGVVYVYVPIENTIKDGCFEQVQTVCKRMGVEYEAKISSKEITILATGSKIKFKGMAMENSNKKPESFKGTTSSEQVLMIVFDELASSNDSSRMDTIVETFAREDCQFIYIFNPPRLKSSWLYEFADQCRMEAELNPDEWYVLHTTVYDLPEEWPSAQRSIENAERTKRKSVELWQHAYLGLPTSEEGVPFPGLDDCLIETEDLPEEFDKFYVFVDNGNKDATVFSLVGKANFKLYVLRVYYDSGRETGVSKPYSDYAQELFNWLDECGMPKSLQAYTFDDGRSTIREEHTIPVITDSFNFTLECKKIGISGAETVSYKQREVSYDLLRELVMNEKVLFYNTDENKIGIEQMENAILEEITVRGRKVDAIKRPDNRFTAENRQIHFVDTMLYMAKALFTEVML